YRRNFTAERPGAGSNRHSDHLAARIGGDQRARLQPGHLHSWYSPGKEHWAACQLRLYSDEIVGCRRPLLTVARRCGCTNYFRSSAEIESRGQKHTRFCAFLCSRSDARGFYCRLVKAGRGESDHYAADAQDVDGSGEEVRRHCLAAKRTGLIATHGG